MRLLFYFFCNNRTGYGHWYRSLAMVEAALDRGHTVFVVSDARPVPLLKRARWQQVRYGAPEDLAVALEIARPDWLVVDLPDVLPDWVEALARCRICVLNGIGYDQANGVALRVIQGVADLELPQHIDRANTLIGMEYVILRQTLRHQRYKPKRNDWLVWGGGNDHLKLLAAFDRVMPEAGAWLVESGMDEQLKETSPAHLVLGESGDALLGWLAASRRACVAMGMICWEAAYLGIPAYVFSASELHLIFARGMAQAGLIEAWPVVGLPGDEEIREFLAGEFRVWGERPDIRGAERILERIERD